MMTRDPDNSPNPEASEAPEALEIRARPQPVTRIRSEPSFADSTVFTGHR